MGIVVNVVEGDMAAFVEMECALVGHRLANVRLWVIVNIVHGGMVTVEIVGVVGVSAVGIDLYVDGGHTYSVPYEGRVHHDAAVHIVMGDTLVDEGLYVGRQCHGGWVIGDL